MAYEASSLQERGAYARTLADAGSLIPRGLFDPATGKPSAAKILLVMETGAMLGLHPMASIQTIDVVEGRATLSAKLQKALITKAGHKVEILKSGSIPGGDYSVTVNATRGDNGDFHTSTWDIARAIRAGSVDSYRQNAQGVWEVRARSKNGLPLPWEAYAENMPVWRAISDIGREGFGDVLFGLYSTEEIGDGLPVDGPAPEPAATSRDWAKAIADATDADALEQIRLDLRETGEGTDDLRTLFLTRKGQLERGAEDIVDAEVVDDEPPAPAELTEEQFDAAAAAEFDAQAAETDG